ncbi:virulence RhuM family protein [Shumkonia mesophila]|uniref:virulence RhuM family protein n=1 Tax=Shumkonia mesophila TaxID=2838854 RepID=UPI0029345085|nr:virulence RhuM family protein [Shumkonia mesophila]
MSAGELILYITEDGTTEIQLRIVDDTVWLTQGEMAELFQTSPQAITQLIKAIYADKELAETATCKELLQVRTEGARQVQRNLKTYNLEVILAVGYRVRSERGIQFRRWATTVLREYLVKGFVMNDERLKDPKFDYFDELLERIRDIRASEARFYQKVRDILALSVDYDAKADSVQTFYAIIQNKMLHAVTHHTAAELIAARADANASNMGLTSWKGGRVRKADVTTAKNYLGEAEIKELNLIVTMFLDTAELRTTRRQEIQLGEWETILDGFLKANELPLLRTAGRISARQAEQIAHERYEVFDAKRKEAERRASEDADELEELKHIAEKAATTRHRRLAPAKKGRGKR